MGYYLPWSVAGGMLSSIGSGLLSTLTPTTSTAKWVGYQILSGAGRGAGFQTVRISIHLSSAQSTWVTANHRFTVQPIIAVQNTLPPSQISIAMSILMFIQTLSGAVFLTFADVIFSTGLKSQVPQYAPKVDPQVIIAAGATGIRNVVSVQDLPAVLKAYAKSVDHVFYLAAALGVVGVVFSFGMGWKDIRKQKPATATEQEQV